MVEAGSYDFKYEVLSRSSSQYRSHFTDDTVMTVAVCEALMKAGKKTSKEKIRKVVVKSMQKWGRAYPDAGYGSRFNIWLKQDYPAPYESYGNGAAMRISSVEYLYDTLERTLEVCDIVTGVTHNHPEGIKGARATVSAIYMARNGRVKEEIKECIEKEFGYDLSRTLDGIRPGYKHVESCQETVPEAIIAFLEATDYSDAVRNAVSLGGDTDTLACITGSIAEAYYGVPYKLIIELEDRLDDNIHRVLSDFIKYKKKHSL